MGRGGRERTYRRAGETAKCPACGAAMDPQAYRCPRCRIYFCFKCRRRVQPRDEQYQCMNQQCDYYGKLLCNACTVEVPRFEEVTHQVVVREAESVAAVPDGIIGCAVLLILAVTFALVVYGGFPWLRTLIVGSVAAVVAAEALNRMKREVPPVLEDAVKKVVAGRVKSCIACRQAVEHLR